MRRSRTRRSSWRFRLSNEEGSLSQRSVVRCGLLACTCIFLIGFAWRALSAGFRQLSRSRTIGQKVQTITQLECGFLSLLVVLTRFWRHRRWAQPVYTIWSITLTVTAGLSSLVWGPPMPIIGALFAALAILVSRAVQWALLPALVD
jgi:hypothetical protein